MNDPHSDCILDQLRSTQVPKPNEYQSKPTHLPTPKRSRRTYVIIFLLALGLVGIASSAAVLRGFLPNPTVAGYPSASGFGEATEPAEPLVKVIRPKQHPNFRISVSQLAMVEPYYQTELRSRVSGVVRLVTKDIGEAVRAGELLIVIDVPDLQQAVEQKSALIRQREKELEVAIAELAIARMATETASLNIKLKVIELNRAKDIRAARLTDLEALTTLFNQKSVVKSRVDAAELDYNSACRAVEAAEAEVEKARLEYSGKTASFDKAKADIELKRSLVEVARKDRDAAAVQYEYSRLYAPFDGVVVSRAVDPGDLVFSGPSGTTEPLMTVARTDLVTVVTKVTDSVAPFVSWNTQAAIEFTQLPGVSVQGPITRYSKFIEPADQTMRVEVDVFTGSREDYQRKLTRSAIISTVHPIVITVFPTIISSAVGLLSAQAEYKSLNEGFSLIPNWDSQHNYQRKTPGTILPGTTAMMRLDLKQFQDAALIPSGAVYSHAGQSYILVVENDITRAIPVTVQINDGILAKVAKIIVSADGQQTTQDLTENDIVVATRQAEVGEGRKIRPVLEKW